MARRLKKYKLKIINRSEWPDSFLKIICDFCAKRADISGPQDIVFSGTKRKEWFRGTAWDIGGETRINLNRRFRPKASQWPYSHKDWRMGWAAEFDLENRVEVLIFIVAHEFYHHGDGRTSRYRRPYGKKLVRVQSMEYYCNKFGYETVMAWRDQRLSLMPKIKKALRTERNRQKREKQKKLDARSPERKLALAKSNLEKWQKKEKYAKNKIRAYKKKVKYYDGRVAACSGKNREKQ